MKLLTRLRELRIQKPVDELFDNLYFSLEHYHGETIGIGTTTYDDIIRLDNENNDNEKSSLNQKRK